MRRAQPPPRIVADVHERASGIPAALRALGAEVEERALAAGDYALGAETLVERKRVLDLHRAIAKGHFWPQLAKLRAACAFAYLLVEGRDLDRGALHPNAVRGACLAAIDDGIALLRSDDQLDSARWLHRLAVRCQRVEPAAEPSLATKQRQPTGAEVAEGLLAAVPGISIVSARGCSRASGASRAC